MKGQETVIIGAKFRMVFPAAYRVKLGHKIIITFGFEGSLLATSEKYWENLTQKEIGDKSFLSEDVRNLRRFFLGGESTLEFDEQGRFIMPEYLREYGKLKIIEKAVFIWQKEYVEIWSEAEWRKKQTFLLSHINQIATALQTRERNG